MRLPDADELKNAFHNKEMATWTKESEDLLWSSES
jgi:hypothetical protein